MASRLILNDELVSILGSRNVYFQAPESLRMQYPCIRYNLAGDEVKHADDIGYNRMHRYELTVIDKDPDRLLYLKLVNYFKYCKLTRVYVADNLNHYNLELYY